ncbi:MAG: DUF2917 domain-containing protein [Burkholderiales bacterium]|nr:DUF2917 domain-containing protein [Burkholderiales bacterium]
MPQATTRHIRLAPRSLLSLPDAAGTEIRSLAGTLWVTVDGDPRDVVLEPGEQFTPSTHGRVIVYALGPAAVELRERAAEPAPAGGWRRALSAAALMLRRPSPTWNSAARG